MKVLSSAVLPSTRQSTALFDGSQISPVCPSDNNSINLKMGVERWRKTEEPKNGKTELLGEKPFPVPLFPLQISPEIAHNGTRDSWMTDRLLTAWAIARPLKATNSVNYV